MWKSHAKVRTFFEKTNLCEKNHIHMVFGDSEKVRTFALRNQRRAPLCERRPLFLRTKKHSEIKKKLNY